MPRMYVTVARKPIGVRRYRSLAGVQSQPLAMRGPRAAVSVIRDVPLELRELSGVGQQGLAHTLSGGIFHGGLGDATTGPESVPPAVDSPVLAALNKRTDEIIARMDAQDKNRKLALMIAGVSALFAAVKLGIIAFPHIKARVSGG